MVALVLSERIVDLSTFASTFLIVSLLAAGVELSLDVVLVLSQMLLLLNFILKLLVVLHEI